MKIRCAIIDDEPLARKGLTEYINDTDFLELVGAFDNPVKAASFISQENIQLLFLDIQMPKITGIDFFKTLHQPPPVIFTTAYPQHALEGFELNALDYLVKPISFDRFFKAALKAKDYYELREKNIPPETEKPNHLFIKTDNKLVRIAFDDILFAEALQNYVVVYTTTKKYITYLTFKAVEDFLPATHFIKTHKSFLVAAARIGSIEGNEIIIASHRIPISRTLKDEVMEKLLNGKFLKR